MVTVTSLDQYKSKITFAGTDNDAAVIAGVNTALLGKSWTVHDAAANTAGYQEAAFNATLVGANPTGLLNTAQTYAATATVDGVAVPILITGSAAQTFTSLVSQINTDLGVAAVATIVGNTILVTSATTGLTSTVSMVDTPSFGPTVLPLFASVSGFARFNASVGGTIGVTYTAMIDDGAASGYQGVNVGGAKVGGSATGYVNSASALYKATITVDGVAYPISFAGNTAQTYTPFLSGLNSVLTTNAVAALITGNLRVTSASTGAASTVSIVDTPASHATQSVSVATAPLGSAVPGLVAESYDFDINIDGGGNLQKTIVIAGGETYTAIAALMNAEIAPAATVTYTGGAFVFVSASTGVASTLLVAPGTAGSGGGSVFAAIATASSHAVTINAAVNGFSPAFASLTNFVSIDVASAGTGPSTMGGYRDVLVGGNKVGASATGLSDETAGIQDVVFVYSKVATDFTGLANDTTAYTADVTVDGVLVPVSVVGSSAQTFTTLLAAINTDLGVAAVATLVNGVIRVTSATTGAMSTVSIVDTGLNPLFSSVVNFYLIDAPIAGTATTYTFSVVLDGGVVNGYQDVNVGANKVNTSATNLVAMTTYTATITVDGVGHPVSILGSTAQTYGALVEQIEADLAGTADVGLLGGNIRVQSKSSGAVSTVAITAGTLFASPLAGFVGVVAAVPGVVIEVSVDGSAAQTYTDLLTEINTDLGSDAVASLNNGNLRITSALADPTSSVVLLDAQLFPFLTDFNGYGVVVPGNDVVLTTQYYVVATVGNGKFAYQQWTAWNAMSHVGTGPGPLFGFSRTPAEAGTIYMYSATRQTSGLVLV